jgi:hypothetical protein
MSDEREAFAAAIAATTAPQSLRVMHKSVVVDQDRDGNVGARLSSETAPTTTAKPVPLLLGLPCFSARIKPAGNLETSIGFHGGAENGAFAALFPTYPQGPIETSPEIEPEDRNLPIEYLSFGGGKKAIARVNDTTANGKIFLRQTPIGPGGVPSLLAISYRAPNAFVETPIATIPIPGPMIPLAFDPDNPDPTVACIVLEGIITSGRTEFRA